MGCTSPNVQITILALRFMAISGALPLFHPEYGRFMLESTPGAPYTGSLPDLLSVERNMRYRCLFLSTDVFHCF